MRRLNLFGIIALLTVAGRFAQAQTAARVREQVSPVKPQKAGEAAKGTVSLASIDAELDRLQRQVDDLRRQLAALRQEAGTAPAKP